MHKVFAAVFFLLFAMPAWAQQVKIGFVDLQRAFNESQPGKSARERVLAQVKKAEADMAREKQDIEKLKADFDKKGPLLKEDDRRRMESDLQKRVIPFLQLATME